MHWYLQHTLHFLITWKWTKHEDVGMIISPAVCTTDIVRCSYIMGHENYNQVVLIKYHMICYTPTSCNCPRCNIQKCTRITANKINTPHSRSWTYSHLQTTRTCCRRGCRGTMGWWPFSLRIGQVVNFGINGAMRWSIKPTFGFEDIGELSKIWPW